jgi:uncharacterized protein (TIGR02996 family)
MSVTEQALLQAILADPDDDLPRLVYADYLEERGDPRAEFIRLQCQLAALQAYDAHRYSLESRIQALVAQHAPEWERPFLDLGAEQCEFRRGFVESVTISATAFLQYSSDLFALAPVRRVHLVEATDHLFPLFQCAALASVSCLDLTENEIPDFGAQALAGSPFLRTLSSLVLCSTKLSDPGIRAILSSECLPALEMLDLSACPLREWDLPTLFDNARLHCFRRLVLEECFPDLRSFFRSPGFPLLTSLDLSSNNLTNLVPLCSCARLENLHTLVLNYNYIEDSQISLLSHSECFRHVHHLDLGSNCIEAPGVRNLLSPHADQFITLDLSFNLLGDAAADLLATGPVLSSLRGLELQHTQLSSSGASALATCRTLPCLTLLNLRSNKINETVAEALRRRFGDHVLL